MAMEFTGSQIRACTSNKLPTWHQFTSNYKLKIRECGLEETIPTEESLLTTCGRIPYPVLGAVKSYIKSNGMGGRWV